jgi:5-deoxy-glucuronate isomerase
MSKLKIHPTRENGRIVHVTPESAGWAHVGFDLWKLKPAEEAAGGETAREVCLVFIGGKGRVSAGSEDFGVLGERDSPSTASPGRSMCRRA